MWNISNCFIIHKTQGLYLHEKWCSNERKIWECLLKEWIWPYESKFIWQIADFMTRILWQLRQNKPQNKQSKNALGSGGKAFKITYSAAQCVRRHKHVVCWFSCCSKTHFRRAGKVFLRAELKKTSDRKVLPRIIFFRKENSNFARNEKICLKWSNNSVTIFESYWPDTKYKVGSNNVSKREIRV